MQIRTGLAATSLVAVAALVAAVATVYLWPRSAPAAQARGALVEVASAAPPPSLVHLHQHEQWQRQLERGGRVLLRSTRDDEVLGEREVRTLGPFSPDEVAHVRAYLERRLSRLTEQRVAFWEGIQGPGITSDQLVEEAEIWRDIELSGAVLRLVESGHYWTVPPNQSVPPAPPGWIYSRLCNMFSTAGQRADLVLLLDLDRFPDYRRAADTVTQYRAYRVDDFVRNFNAMDEEQRRTRFRRHMEALVALRAEAVVGTTSQPELQRLMADRLPPGVLVDEGTIIARAVR